MGSEICPNMKLIPNQIIRYGKVEKLESFDIIR